jgi:hypothetical protein
MLVLPNGSTWSGKLGDLLRVLNGIWTEKLNAMVQQVEELEKHGDRAAMEKAVNEIDIQMTAN